MKSKKKVFTMSLVFLMYAILITTPIFALSTFVSGLNYNTNTYYVPPVTKIGTTSLSGDNYAYKSVTACVGSCTTTGLRRAFEVKTSHAGFSWNRFNSYYTFK